VARGVSTWVNTGCRGIGIWCCPLRAIPLAAKVAEIIQRNIRALPEQVKAAENWWREHGDEVRAEQEARAQADRR
jgi:hypothetical protein